jgi:hypothetical protein
MPGSRVSSRSTPSGHWLAHVVICAHRAGQSVVTSDPGDLRALDPAISIITI